MYVKEEKGRGKRERREGEKERKGEGDQSLKTHIVVWGD